MLIIIIILVLFVLYCTFAHYSYMHPPKEIIGPFAIAQYTISMPYGLLYKVIHPIRDKEIYICISIDGDLPENETLANKAIEYTLKLLKEENLEGNVTWFINEGEYNWTKNYPGALRALIQKDYDIELHSHYVEKYWNKTGEKPSYGQIFEQYKKERESLEDFIENKIHQRYEIIGFRGGCHVMISDSYKALKSLGFKFDSSEVPGFRRYMNHSFIDYTDIPLSRNWYFRENGLLELPTYIFIPTLTYIKVLKESHKSIIVLSHFFHTYNFVNKDGSLNKLEWVIRIAQFWLLKQHYANAKWITTREMYGILKTIAEESK